MKITDKGKLYVATFDEGRIDAVNLSSTLDLIIREKDRKIWLVRLERPFLNFQWKNAPVETLDILPENASQFWNLYQSKVKEIRGNHRGEFEMEFENGLTLSLPEYEWENWYLINPGSPHGGSSILIGGVGSTTWFPR